MTSVRFFTIVARNYLSHAFVLGDSVLRYHPDATFSIFLMDDLDQEWRSSIERRGFGVIYPEEVPLGNYLKLTFQYTIIEASTAVKPSVIRMLLERGAEKVIYLDPDILCFRRFDEVFAALEKHHIVLTPHICSPAPNDSYPGEKGLLNSGIFNLGFIALRSSDTVRCFLEWWAERLRHDCVAEPELGLFVDQKWMDLAPTCFDHVYIMKLLTYNIAYWNLHERVLEQRGDYLYEVCSSERVAFFHFSGFDIADLTSIFKYRARNPLGYGAKLKRPMLSSRPDLETLLLFYKDLLTEAGVEEFSKIPYTFATYRNGETISNLERALYRTSDIWGANGTDPFATGKDSFHYACRRAGVRAVSRQRGKKLAERPLSECRLPVLSIEFLLRCCLFFLGPQLYFLFARYMRHQLMSSNQGFLLKNKLEKPRQSKLVDFEQPIRRELSEVFNSAREREAE